MPSAELRCPAAPQRRCRWRSWCTVWAVLLLGMLPGVARAYTCAVSATATAFGNYVPTSVVANDTTGTVTVTCNANVSVLTANYTVALSTGGSASYANRLMSGGGHTLQYQLYKDVARTTVWGDGTASTSTVAGSVLLSLTFPVLGNHTVYGRIPASQTGAYAGSYSDTITVTVTY